MREGIPLVGIPSRIFILKRPLHCDPSDKTGGITGQISVGSLVDNLSWREILPFIPGFLNQLLSHGGKIKILKKMKLQFAFYRMPHQLHHISVEIDIDHRSFMNPKDITIDVFYFFKTKCFNPFKRKWYWLPHKHKGSDHAGTPS